MDNSLAIPVLIAISGVLLTNILSAVMTARTAKSKGRSFGLFLVFGLISWLIAAAVVIFISPKGSEKARPKNTSAALLVIGFAVEAWGVGMLPLDPSMSDAQVAAALMSNSSIGAMAIVAAGVVTVIAAVSAEKVRPATDQGQ